LADKLKTEVPDLKVIYTSGYSLDLMVKAMEDEEGLNFIQKPVSASHSAKALQQVPRCLQRSR